MPADQPPQTVTSTSYCDTGTMADGSQTRNRSVAMNMLSLGTKILLVGPRSRTFYGLRRFVVRDHIGWGSQLDFWHRSCSASTTWGRRPVRFVLGWWR
jgi:3D (Asp-Asp-Asp) domain-containing protein